MVTFTVAVSSTPIAQPRARHVAGRSLPVSTADKKVKAYRRHLIAEMERAAEKDGWRAPSGPVRVSWKAYRSTRDKTRWWGWCDVKPDRDNIDKLVLDCAQAAGVIAKGDQKVAAGTLEKFWVPPGHEGLIIVFEALEARPVPADEDPEDDLGALETA